MPVSIESQLAALLDVGAMAALLNCSARHVYRMCDAGKMPPPVRLGALVRWNRSVIEKWISEGCPTFRAVTVQRGRS